MEFRTQFLDGANLLVNNKCSQIVGHGHDIESAQEDLVRQVIENMRAIIAEHRTVTYVSKEDGFWDPY
jgi:hypothetical protein